MTATSRPIRSKSSTALLNGLFHCCQDRVLYQSRRFELPDAEMRCLTLFGEERYLTPRGIARRMNVAKSRVSKILQKLVDRGLVQKTPDPEDSRGYLVSLTPDGLKKTGEINAFMDELSAELLRQMNEEQRRSLLTCMGVLHRSMQNVKATMFQDAEQPER
jgi:DNA-binding MarR family transcriptional regulator